MGLRDLFSRKKASAESKVSLPLAPVSMDDILREIRDSYCRYVQKHYSKKAELARDDRKKAEGSALEQFLAKHKGSGFLMSAGRIIEADRLMQTQAAEKVHREMHGRPTEADQTAGRDAGKNMQYSLVSIIYEIPWPRIDWNDTIGKRIWIGRTENNIIHINDKRISKSQCYLVQENSRVVCADNGSTYGTYVHGKKLGPEEKAVLTSRSELVLNSVAFTYLSAEDFFYTILWEFKDKITSSSLSRRR